MKKKKFFRYGFVLLIATVISGCWAEITQTPLPQILQTPTATMTIITPPSSIVTPSFSPTVAPTPIVKLLLRGVIAVNIFSRKYTHFALIDLETGEIQNFMAFGSSPSWSPDGQWLAFVNVSRSGGDTKLFKLRPDGTDLTMVANVNSQLIDYLKWSPDGQFIMYSFQQDTTYGIAIVSADGGSPRVITDGNRAPYSLTWSPDGKHIAYFYVEGSQAPIELRVIDVNGENAKPVNKFAHVPGGDVAWSPDGQWLAIIYEKAPGKSEMVCNEIYLIKPDGSELTRLTDLLAQSRCAERVVWSPDGKYLAFVGRNITSGQANSVDEEQQIYVMDMESKAISAITNEQDWFIYSIDWGITQ
jgi:Tol biopolymer transport system component